MSADWQGFMAWLVEEGVSDPDAARERFSALASTSDRASLLKLILDGAYGLQDADLLRVLAGVASLMTQLEWAPQADDRRRQLIGALDGMLTELDIDRPGTLATALCHGIDDRQRLISGTMTLQLARQMLADDPHASQMMLIARLCNLSLDNLLHLLRGLLQQAPDEAYVNDARVAFQYAFTRYTDAARQLNQELDAALFADLSPGLPSPRQEADL